MAVQVSRIGQYGALVSLTVGGTPVLSVLASSAPDCGICFVVGGLNADTAQVRCSIFFTLDGDETSSQKMLAAAFTVEIRGN